MTLVGSICKYTLMSVGPIVSHCKQAVNAAEISHDSAVFFVEHDRRAWRCDVDHGTFLPSKTTVSEETQG